MQIVGGGERNRVDFDQSSPPDGRVHIEFDGSDNQVSFGRDIHIGAEGCLYVIVLGNRNRITLGSTLWFGGAENTLKIFPAGPGADGSDCSITIGDNCNFAGTGNVLKAGEAGTHIGIGDDCLFASGIVLATSSNHCIFDAATGRRTNPARNIMIDRHVWICREALIFGGVSIGRDSVVGARSIVTKAFDETGVVIAGAPAKIVRHGINWSREIARQEGP